MLNVLKYVPKHVALAVTLATAFLTSFTAFASPEVTIESNVAVANYSRGDTTWKADSVDASYDEVVRFKVYYHNTELPDSGKIAENVSIKVDMPTSQGSTQTVTTTVKGDNTNTVVDTASVNINRSDAYLELVPGSVEWRYNNGTRSNITYTTEQLPDSVVTGNGFTVIEDQKPCFEYEAWITFAARVRVPSLEIEKQVADQDEQEWAESVTSTPGSEVKFLLTIRNNGNARVNDVTVKDVLPEGLEYVPGTTTLFNSNHPNGVKLSDNIVTSGGVGLGDLPNDTTVYLGFRATVVEAEELDCGLNHLVNTARAFGSNYNGDEDTAKVKVTRECVEEPTYDCEVLATIFDSKTRKVNAEVTTSSTGDVTLESVSIDFGDGTVATNNPAEHTYAADGDYDIVATVKFDVSGEIKEVTCQDKVSFDNQVEKCPIPGKGDLDKNDPNCKEEPQTPPELPNTGAGSVLFTLLGASSAASAGYGFIRSRKA